MNDFSPAVRVVYRCASCQASYRYFLLYVTQTFPVGNRHQLRPGTSLPSVVQKIGQFPAWDIAPQPELARWLGTRVGIFKKGLICESQGFGIGAFGYYRRIVEDVIDTLLTDIAATLGGDVEAEFARAVVAAQGSNQASDKIAHVKDLLPPPLRPDGMNPLSILHDALSKGLHTLNDDECLTHAAAIRTSLLFLVRHTSELKASGDEFRKSLQSLLDAKSSGYQANEQTG